jgi:ubiquinone/menaquinone biosynthesis C-methylase UbiE
MNHQHGFTLKGSLSRAVQEARYVRQPRWSLEDVGRFWSSVTDYDDINEDAYPYSRRFTNSFELAGDLIGRDNFALDIQSRTGNGSLFWAERGFIRQVHLVDFCDYMLEIASSNLSQGGVEFDAHLVRDFPLPFADETFDLVLSYETIEHIWERATFVRELARVLKVQGWMILTCPNILWEPVHWLSATFNLHHSEGPHRFLRRDTLLSLFKSNKLEVVRENSTVILPFSSKASISTDRFLERTLPELVKRTIALRRTFVLRKAMDPGMER